MRGEPAGGTSSRIALPSSAIAGAFFSQPSRPGCCPLSTARASPRNAGTVDVTVNADLGGFPLGDWLYDLAIGGMTVESGTEMDSSKIKVVILCRNLTP